MGQTAAENCLDAKQIRRLERTVSGCFDYTEDLIERENVFNKTQAIESDFDHAVRAMPNKAD